MRFAVGVLAAAAVSCGVPSEPRWERGAIAPIEIGGVTSTEPAGARATVESGSVVAAAEFASTVSVADSVVASAPIGGRVEVRTTAVGDAVAADAVVIEIGSASDEVDELRRTILDDQRALAVLLDDTDEIARLDEEIAAASVQGAGPTTPVASPMSGVVDQYFVSRFDVVEQGDPLFSVGDAGSAQIVVALGALDEDVEASVGMEVRIAIGRSTSAFDPLVAIISDIDDTGDGRRVIIGVPESAGVGDSVSVVFESVSAPTSVRVPSAVVRTDSRGDHVIVERGSAWHRVDVRVGARTTDFSEIVDSSPPLAAGDVVVVP